MIFIWAEIPKIGVFSEAIVDTTAVIQLPLNNCHYITAIT